MRTIIGAFVGVALLLGGGAAEARPVRPASIPSPAIVNPAGSTVGPQTIPGGTLVNQGTIAGGSSTAITSTGPAPVVIQNNGTITSSTSGILTTGSASSIINNAGTISIINSQTGTGSVTATMGTGIRQSTKP